MKRPWNDELDAEGKVAEAEKNRLADEAAAAAKAKADDDALKLKAEAEKAESKA